MRQKIKIFFSRSYLKCFVVASNSSTSLFQTLGPGSLKNRRKEAWGKWWVLKKIVACVQKIQEVNTISVEY